MKIMKFEGATMRDAVAKVKAELGDQAVIIASRQVRRGLLGTAVEISAAIDDEDAAPSRYADSPAFTANPSPSGRDGRNGPDVESLLAPVRTELRSLRAMVRGSGDTRGLSKLESEVSALRQLVEELRTTPPAATFAPPVERPIERARRGVDRAPTVERARRDDDPDGVSAAIQSHLARTMAPEPAREAREVSSRDVPLVAPSTARIILLVGPTGAGKTTTIAKLAAQAALVEERRVRLITLDTYRVGGIDQIRTFAELIGVPLSICQRPGELATAIDDDDELTLIDTAGRSPRDTAGIIELAAAFASLPAIEVHVVVPATATAAAIDEIVGRYAALSPARLLFTKLDEQDRVPELLRAPCRTGLPITWVTTGQAVPEDLEEPTATRVRTLSTHGLSHAAHRAA